MMFTQPFSLPSATTQIYQQKPFNKSELIDLSFLFLSAIGQLANMTKNTSMYFLFEVIHNVVL